MLQTEIVDRSEPGPIAVGGEVVGGWKGDRGTAIFKRRTLRYRTFEPQYLLHIAMGIGDSAHREQMLWAAGGSAVGIGFLQRFSCLARHLLNAHQHAGRVVIQFGIKQYCCLAGRQPDA